MMSIDERTQFLNLSGPDVRPGVGPFQLDEHGAFDAQPDCLGKSHGLREPLRRISREARIPRPVGRQDRQNDERSFSNLIPNHIQHGSDSGLHSRVRNLAGRGTIHDGCTSRSAFAVTGDMPGPCARHDGPEVRCRGPEMDDPPRRGRVRNKNRRIPSPTFTDGTRNIASSNVCNSVEHLLDRISTAGAEVAASSTLSRQQGLHRADMGRSKVHDMDIIADGRTVGGGIVGPEYGELAKLSRESRHGSRYQMRLVLALLADARFWSCAARVEVSQGE